MSPGMAAAAGHQTHLEARRGVESVDRGERSERPDRQSTAAIDYLKVKQAQQEAQSIRTESIISQYSQARNLAANLGSGTGSADIRENQSRPEPQDSRQFLPMIASKAEPHGGTAPERSTAAETSSAVHFRTSNF